MKRTLRKILMLGFIFAVAVSCDKDETEDISRITYFPEFEMTGDEYYFIEKGQTYEEPGIKAFEGGSEVEVNTTGSVNTSEVGVNFINYTATNSDGFSKSVKRTVVVYDGNIASNDLTGTYAGGYYGDATMEVTKEKDGLYYSTDIFGYGPPYEAPSYIVDLGGNQLVVLPAPSAFGQTLLTEGTYTDEKLAYVLGITGYGYVFDLEWIKQ